MRLGVCSACLPELTPGEAIEAAVAAGYAGIEWRVSAEAGSPGPAHFLTNNRCTLRPEEGDIRRARELCDRAGLAVIGLSGYVPAGDVQGVEQLMRLAAETGTPRIRLWAPSMTDGGFHEALGRGVEFFDEVAALAGRFGVQALLEMHQRTICPSTALAKQVVGHLPPHLVGVVYDPGNAVVEGSEDPRMALQILGEHLAHVHIKNAAFERPEGGGPWRHRWTPMDDGVLDVPAILRLLHDAGYRGWVSVEDFSTDRPPREALAFNAAYLRGHVSFEAAEGGQR
ncbi:sugar phosphate isomerase/epimerase [Microbispora sp. GKU 823]|uniref:sugar phosphate isomerase/epimerase family protein n=1 Tax=Microbispora sp. GKU 823 TaxID=1652100 RepID=UPI0009A3F92C|nr:sugar phosphate isomerase/epimerase family protein [Microbispora sp. GKU 823]OPG12394.1 sugar phosphate isomerase [Microbispora sp. GKU 823]